MYLENICASWKSGIMAYGKGNELLRALVKVPTHTANILASLHWKSAGGRVERGVRCVLPSSVCMGETSYPLCPSATSHTVSLLVLQACTMIRPRPFSSLKRQSAVYNRDAMNQPETKNPLSVTVYCSGWRISFCRKGDFKKQLLYEVTEEKIVSQDYKKGWITPHC